MTYRNDFTHFRSAALVIISIFTNFKRIKGGLDIQQSVTITCMECTLSSSTARSLLGPGCFRWPPPCCSGQAVALRSPWRRPPLYMDMICCVGELLACEKCFFLDITINVQWTACSITPNWGEWGGDDLQPRTSMSGQLPGKFKSSTTCKSNSGWRNCM